MDRGGGVSARGPGAGAGAGTDGGGGGADGGKGLADGGGCDKDGACGTVAFDFRVDGSGGGAEEGTETDDDGLGAGFGGGGFFFDTIEATEVVESLDCGVGRSPLSLGIAGAEAPGNGRGALGAKGAEFGGGLS